MTQRRRLMILLVWLAGILFPVAGFFGLFPGGRTWFDDHTRPEALHISAHIVLFAGLVLLLAATLAWPPRLGRVLLIYAVALALGTAQETFQVLTAGYEAFTPAEYFDLGIDLLGASIGVLWWLWREQSPGQRAS